MCPLSKKKAAPPMKEEPPIILLNDDGIRLVLAAIKYDSWQVAARAAARWCLVSKTHRDACMRADDSWRALSDRYFENLFTLNPPAPPRRSFLRLCERKRRTTNAYNVKGALSTEHEQLLEALRIDGDVLNIHYSPNRPCDDRELVLTAVRTRGFTLRCASLRLRDDREVVLTAVRNCGSAHWFAAPKLFMDPEVVDTARARGGREDARVELARTLGETYGQ